jgi:predicted secreted hydrolase
VETLKRFLLKSALSAFRVELVGAGFDFTLTLTETQPLLLQGDRGLSRKGPEPKQASSLVENESIIGAITMRLDRCKVLQLKGENRD